MALRFVETGRADADVVRWLRAGLQNFFDAGTGGDLDRLLGLPSNSQALRLARRNLRLLDAAREIGGASPAKRLAQEYGHFLTRGPWRAWRALDAPPPDASRLRALLFFVARDTRDGESLSERHIARILGHNFAEQCPTEPPTMT